MAGCPWDLVPPEPHAASRAGLRCPGLSFHCTLPQHAPHALDPTPLIPLTPSLSHMPFLPPRLCPRPGAAAAPAAPGLGIQPAGRTQGAVARAAAGRAAQGEIRAPQRPGSQLCAPPSFPCPCGQCPSPHREAQGPSHSPSCPSALPGGEPFVVPPGAPSRHRPVLVTPSQGCNSQRE